MDKIPCTISNETHCVKQLLSERLEYGALKICRCLWNNRDIMLEIAKHHKCPRMTLSLASDELKGDAEFAEVVLSRDGLALEHVSLELRDNEDIVETAIRWGNADEEIPDYCRGRVLQYASQRLRDKISMVIFAEQESRGNAILYASERISKLVEDCATPEERLERFRRLLFSKCKSARK